MKYTEGMARAAMLAVMEQNLPREQIDEQYTPLVWDALLRLAVLQQHSGDYSLIYFWGLLPLLTHLVTFNLDHWNLTWA